MKAKLLLCLTAAFLLANCASINTQSSGKSDYSKVFPSQIFIDKNTLGNSDFYNFSSALNFVETKTKLEAYLGPGWKEMPADKKQTESFKRILARHGGGQAASTLKRVHYVNASKPNRKITLYHSYQPFASKHYSVRVKVDYL